MDQCIDMSLRHQSTVLVSKENERLSKQARKFAKLKRLPQLQLFTGNAFALDDLGRSRNQLEFRTGMILKYPLYDGGETRHQIETAKTNHEKAKLEYEKTVQELNDQMISLYNDYTLNQKLLKLSDETSILKLEIT